MTAPLCPKCQSKAVGLQVPHSPEMQRLRCRHCGHEWEVRSDQYSADALGRLAPLPHWR